MPHYTATLTVGQKTFKARTTADNPDHAAYKIGIHAATRFPAQKVSIGKVEVDALETLKNMFGI